jgi:hypothetical protein
LPELELEDLEVCLVTAGVDLVVVLDLEVDMEVGVTPVLLAGFDSRPVPTFRNVFSSFFSPLTDVLEGYVRLSTVYLGETVLV